LNPSGPQSQVVAELQALYAWADAEVAAHSPRCEASGKCCRFKEYGHRLYLCQVEARHLLENAPPYPMPANEAGCPFQVDSLCTRRETRPLGCRVYFCDPSFSGAMEAIMEEGIRRLKEITDRHQLGWDYASLHAFLNDPARSGVTAQGPASEIPSCDTLPRSLPLVS
jgi:Fe-S-cluster containining protein